MTSRKRLAYKSLLDGQVLRNLVADGGSRLLVAVSGGADSVALLLALYEAQDELNLQLEVAHYDHGLRDDSAVDSRFVRELCGRLGLPIHTETMTGLSRPGGVSPEAFWRDQRYRFFAGIYESTQCDALALGHTLDDMAETFLYHLARGTGVEGARFSPVKEVLGMRLVRPFWQTRRADIEGVLNAQGQVWREDPTNDDPRFSRNLIRHKVMPALREINPDACGAIARFCEDVASVGVEAEFEDLPDKLRIEDIVPCDAPATARLLRAFILARGGLVPSRKQVDHAAGMLAKRKPGLVSLADSRTLVIDQVSVWMYPGNEPTDKQLASYVAGQEGRILAEVEATHSLEGDTARLRMLTGGEVMISAAEMVGACGLRNRREGDRLGGRLLKKLLIDRKVPWYLRDYLVFYVDGQDNVIGLLGNEDLGLVRGM